MATAACELLAVRASLTSWRHDAHVASSHHKARPSACLVTRQSARCQPLLASCSSYAGQPLLAQRPVERRHIASNRAVAPRAAKGKAPPVMPLVMTPGGPTDLVTAFFRNRIIFVGSQINAQVAQRVISQLMTLAAISETEDIKMYINCPGGSTYSVLAIYDCMSWVKPDVSTVGFGLVASQGALILSGGTKGKRFLMPNTRVMIHQPQGSSGGNSEDVRRQVSEVVASRSKIDQMFAAFTGQPLERVRLFTERDRFFSSSEAVEFGLVDEVIETAY